MNQNLKSNLKFPLILVFSSRVHSFALFVQYLKIIIPSILSSFLIVHGGMARVALVSLLWPEAGVPS